jgi:hypothetical protein
MNTCARSFWLLVVLAFLLVAPAASAVVTMDWVTIGSPGNAADSTSFGMVADVYQIGRYEVTNAQYAEFLNAVAATDTILQLNLPGPGDGRECKGWARIVLVARHGDIKTTARSHS